MINVTAAHRDISNYDGYMFVTFKRRLIKLVCSVLLINTIFSVFNGPLQDDQCVVVIKGDLSCFLNV